MRFGVLGPLSVDGPDGPVRLQAGIPRTLLAMLLSRPNQVVGIDRLAVAVWGDEPPPAAAPSLRNHVLRLRQRLGEAGRSRIHTAAHGYLVEVHAGELDETLFVQECRRGRRDLGAGELGAAGERLASALALWRGDPFPDLAADAEIQLRVRQLQETRLLAWHDRIEADLGLGRHHDVIPEARALAEAHPLREDFHGQLMLALYRAGRQADALAAFQALRRALIDDLGVEPSAELRSLQQRILTGDADLAAPAGAVAAPGSPAPAPPAPVPRQLPAAVDGFAGRAQTLGELSELIRPAGAGPQPIVSIIGGAGVGKTTLAVHWGHQIAARFPDGCLYVDLRGFAADSAPMTTDLALRGFLHGLGVTPPPASEVPHHLAGLYRSLLADRRMLVILDNAHDAEQVRPLLPGAPGCLTVVTSRTSLAGLVAVEGARSFRLGALPVGEAFELLTTRLGDTRVRADREAFQRLIRSCGALPLALAVAAARLALEPDLAPADLAARLDAERGRLDELHLADAAGDVRAVFSWSYRRLSPAAATVFRCLGLHPGPSVPRDAMPSLAGLTGSATTAAVRELTDGHLVRAVAGERLQLHDLLWQYAAERAEAELDPAALRAARRRLLDYFLHSAYAAERLGNPTRPAIDLPLPPPGIEPAAFPGAAAATAWLDRETAVLPALAALAAQHGFDEHAWRIPWTIAVHLDRRGQWQDLVTVLEIAAAAADRQGDPAVRTRAHCDAAHGLLRTGRLDAAAGHLRLARRLSAETGDIAEQARVELKLGAVCEAHGDLAGALGHSQAGLALAGGDGAGDAPDEAVLTMALAAVAWFHTLCGQYEEGLARAAEALAGHRRIGRPIGQAHVLDTVGLANLRLGRPHDALTAFTEAERIFDACDDRYHRLLALAGVASAHDALGEESVAREHRKIAEELLADLGPAEDDPIRMAVRGR